MSNLAGLPDVLGASAPWSGYGPTVAADRNARSSPLIVRGCPVTLKVALARRSLELLPALSSTGTGLHDQVAGEPGVGEQAHRHHEGDGLRRPGLQVDAGEPDELVRGQGDAGGRVGGVQLHDLGPAPVPGVGDGEGRPKLAAHVDGVAPQLQVR